MDGDDGILAIVLAAEHLLGLARFDFGEELVETARQIVGDRLPGLRPFDQDGEVVHPAAERVAQVAILLEPPAALEQLLGVLLILPEVRVGNAQLYPGELVGGAGRVKDSSADRMRVWRDPDTGGAARRVEWKAWASQLF
jgi:hypothetical protein